MTAAKLSAKQERRASRIDPLLKATVRQVGQRMRAVSDRLLTQEIYSKPEDRWPSGRPKWRRTNRLAHGEQLELGESGLAVALVNRVEYAEPRHEANKPGRRQINRERTAHWRDDMLLLIRPEIAALMEGVAYRLGQGT